MRQKISLHADKGFTLLELMTVIVILVVLASLAALRAGPNVRDHVVAGGRQMYSLLYLARAEAIRSGVNVNLDFSTHSRVSITRASIDNPGTNITVSVLELNSSIIIHDFPSIGSFYFNNRGFLVNGSNNKPAFLSLIICLEDNSGNTCTADSQSKGAKVDVNLVGIPSLTYK